MKQKLVTIKQIGSWIILVAVIMILLSYINGFFCTDASIFSSCSQMSMFLSLFSVPLGGLGLIMWIIGKISEKFSNVQTIK